MKVPHSKKWQRRTLFQSMDVLTVQFLPLATSARHLRPQEYGHSTPKWLQQKWWLPAWKHHQKINYHWRRPVPFAQSTQLCVSTYTTEPPCLPPHQWQVPVQMTSRHNLGMTRMTHLLTLWVVQWRPHHILVQALHPGQHNMAASSTHETPTTMADCSKRCFGCTSIYISCISRWWITTYLSPLTSFLYPLANFTDAKLETKVHSLSRWVQ